MGMGPGTQWAKERAKAEAKELAKLQKIIDQQQKRIALALAGPTLATAAAPVVQGFKKKSPQAATITKPDIGLRPPDPIRQVKPATITKPDIGLRPPMTELATPADPSPADLSPITRPGKADPIVEPTLEPLTEFPTPATSPAKPDIGLGDPDRDTPTVVDPIVDPVDDPFDDPLFDPDPEQEPAKEKEPGPRPGSREEELVKPETIIDPGTASDPDPAPFPGFAADPSPDPDPEEETKENPAAAVETGPAPFPGWPTPPPPVVTIAPGKPSGTRPPPPPPPSRPPTKGGKKIPPPPPPPGGKIRLGDFKREHATLPEGVNPSRVQWKQGKVYRNVDLATGASETTRIPVGKGVRPGTTPEQTLKIIETSRAKPKVRRVDIGKTIAVVTKNKITYYAEAGPPVRGYQLAAKKPKQSKRGLYL